MYALDGAPRITHIWGFTSLEERTELRSRAYEAGVWPPKGGPEQIAEATSTIALPQGPSPPGLNGTRLHFGTALRMARR
ncbi:NIPSNAP family protein [Methylobacterium komagatae]